MDTNHTEQLKEYAKSYWQNIDVEALQPVLYGPEPTEVQKELSVQQMNKIKELARLYRENNKISNKDTILYPELEK